MACRSRYEEDDRDPPCDEKGHCPTGAVELLPENDQAYDLYKKIKLLGAETVFGFSEMKLSAFEAETLLEKMFLIASIIAEWEAAQKPQTT